ncbi:chemotaxis protein CheB [Desulfatitalea alkaliphila]|uniref:protein-glutamate O-methyltransferase n=1 Tax=Desulfatitalea alkaliphila TaxID=2929485 RepID=A0AA41UJZ3_9BACT|nr:chemotaxis protein CheB [Desulfatitalea alkaliphila]MCJ8499831.1 PAS domain-containing protein [Desulfatitalea alkaliphila]
MRSNAFPIVGIGASAGGLEALELFLRHVPDGSGMAFVIVQHLDPNHKGILVELLQRTTTMPVVQIKDRQQIAADCVYVIPPNKDLSILHGVLHLLEPAAPRGLRLPIDFFFRSLADDCGSRSIGVILSGMGSDGTLGLRAIKEKAGVVLVQTPASAKFDGMPRSAIAAGLADVVAPAEELPVRIATYLKRAPLDDKSDSRLASKTQSALEKIYILLRTQTGHDFSLYKKSTIYRRVERRMGLHQIDKIALYVRYLRENPQEVELLFKELLIGVTSFFRDPPAWAQLKAQYLPGLLAAHADGAALRAWVCGCSTGEEAYSLAMVFKEVLAQAKPAGNVSLQIFATDLDRDAIDKARAGIYPANIAADVSDERLQRFFVRDDLGYRVIKEIREMVIFAPQNVIMDPPFTKMDLLICRNLLIYLDQEMQKKLMPLFHYSLNADGILFLGSAETIGAFTTLFAPLDGKNRFYRRLDTPQWAEPIDFPAAFTPHPPSSADDPAPARKPGANLQSLAELYLLQHHCPAAVLTNDKGDILFISGRTGKYLEPAAGRANWNVFAMAREGLRYVLNTAWRKALQQNAAVVLKGVQVDSNGGLQIADVTVEAITAPAALKGMMMVVFEQTHTPPEAESAPDSARADGRGADLTDLERELQQARDEIQTCREERRTSQEELKSTNEELQSTNEELQSTNEELTTSKEEMQSLNEELQTINHELQAKVDELSQANNDMKNLLNSTDIATLFLDDALTVRRFTDRTTQIIKLIPGDAGRPITDVVTDLDYPQMTADAKEVLRTLVFTEKQVATHDGRWFLVRIMPYRTMDNRIDGVVITFSNITEAKALEARLRQALAENEKRDGKGNA